MHKKTGEGIVMSGRRRVRVKKRFYVLIAGLIAAFFVVQFIRVDQKLAQQNAQLAELDVQISRTQAYNDSLETQIAEADSLENIEKTAREQLGWVRENEILYTAESPDGAAQEQ